MKKTDVPTFTLKLRKLMAGRSRIEAADVMDIPAGTFRTWLSKGSQPAPNQVAKLATYLGCSVDYLCDDDIDVDADPTSGAKFDKPLSKIDLDELMLEVGSRYFAQASTLIGAIELAKRIDWKALAQAIVKDGVDSLDAEQLDAIRIAIGAYRIAQKLPTYDPSNKLWLVPFMKGVKGVSSDDLDQVKLRGQWQAMTTRHSCISSIVLFMLTQSDDPETRKRLKEDLEMSIQLD